MAHKADHTFFDEKKSWSARKDRILGSYLRAYLPKIATQRLPILLVDGFAGAGQFKDGTLGSPLIMRNAIIHSKLESQCTLIAIEADPHLFTRLESNLRTTPFANVKKGNFEHHVEEIARLASASSTFLYLDPFTVKGLDLEQLHPVLSWVRKNRSVELLLNFNVPIFVRWGRAALERPMATKDLEELPQSPELARLDRIVGGSWWRSIIEATDDFAESVNGVVHGFAEQLRQYFDEVCFHPVYERTSHVAPKYVLVFASRHPQALILMNDEMVKSREALVELEAEPEAPTLFETRDERWVPDQSK
ncbi:MAG: three-Cys-motif partner protein TcmP, partial [Planctomycetota bacterium]